MYDSKIRGKRTLSNIVVYLIAALVLLNPAWGEEVTGLIKIPDTYFVSPLDLPYKQYSEGDYESTLSSLATLKTKDPRRLASDRLYILEGLALTALKQPEQASLSFREALKYRASNPEALALLALTTYNQGNFQESVNLLEEAAWLGKCAFVGPGDVPYHLAKAYQGLANTTKASSILTTNLAKNPQHAASRLLLAQLSMQGGNRREAINQAREAMKQDPSAVAKLELARALVSNADRSLQKTDIAEAKKLALESMGGETRGKTSDPAFPIYIKALMAGGELQDAERLIKNGLKQTPTNTELKTLAQQLELEKQSNKAPLS